MTATAPVRADHVGSLLRPERVHEARVRYHAERLGPGGFHTSSELRAVEDQAIREAVRMQESVGLKAVTDGEYRRSFWHYDFMGALSGMELEERQAGVQFHGVTLRPIFRRSGQRSIFPAITRCWATSATWPRSRPCSPRFRSRGRARVTSGRRRLTSTRRIPRSRRPVRRHRAGVSQGRARVLRRRLPLPADG